jgi:Concanavalin A-like lectin/glucanases superfamily
MNRKFQPLAYAQIIFSLCVVLFSCQKLDRPNLADYPKDANPPGGPLKFYAAFDGTGTDVLKNAVDSVRASFAVDNPFTAVAGISGKAVKGLATKDKAIKYPSANDFSKSTSITVAYWLKNAPATDGEPEFHFSLPSKDFWHESALFLLVEKGGPDAGNSTADSMACTFAVQDHWVEFRGKNRLSKVLDGNWHHLVFVYDQATSKVSAYVDGVASTYTGTGNLIQDAGKPLGALKFANVNNFVLGGWNKHASGTGGATDAWIHSYSGTMDQFRLYGKALSASEVLALYNSKL